ncbi:Variant-specific surface protein, partial [Giardia duodenalis]
VCREARDGACMGYAEEARAERAGAGERIDKQGEPEMQREVKAAQVTCIEGTNTGQCKTGKCINIGEDRVCTDCGKAGEVPINGKCVAYNNDLVTTAGCTKNNGDPVDASSTTCGKCTKTGYFLHKGGCYAQATAPGSTICKTAGSTAGICEVCQAGYFKNPANVATSDSCIACGDTTGVTVSGATYKGVLNCAVCTAPQAGGSGEVATCTACVDGKYGDTCATDCNSSCKSCTGVGTAACTSCKDPSPYFKKGDGETGECVAEADCNGSYFPNDDVDGKKQCIPCGDSAHGGIDGCTTCAFSQVSGQSTLTCSVCTPDTKKPNADGTKCVDCAAAGCAKCSDEGVCVECDSSKYLTPTAQCVDSCDKLGGYYADSNVCKSCDPSCASCAAVGANKCLSCPAGKVLKYTSESSPTDGSCMDECKANTDGCADCGATIGGSRYCSKCNDASQAPLNGNCAANTARIQFCTKVDGGACTQCANGYFLLDGGCYETGRQPGKSVCTTANNGQCQTCANTLSPSNGVCPACPAGCSKCSGSSGSQTCSECLAGYYLSGTSCVKCSENGTNGGTNIQGIKDCMSYILPSGNQRPVARCSKIDSSTSGKRGDGVDKNGFSISVVTCASSLDTLTIGGLAEFFVNDRPIAIAGRYLLEEADLSAVYESTSLCNVPTRLLRRRLSKFFSEQVTTSISAHRE